MAVIKGYINSMAISRELYLKKWDGLKNTTLRHIAKMMLIIDGDSLKVWWNEIDGYINHLASYETKSNISNKTYFENIFGSYMLENQKGVVGVVENAIKDYCCDPKNKTNTAMVREWESRLKEVESDINTIFKAFVVCVRDAKEYRGGSYDYGTLQNIDDVKNAVARNHAIKQYKVWHCVERRKLTIKYVGTL